MGVRGFQITFVHVIRAQKIAFLKVTAIPESVPARHRMH
jgi:hypothetical protein